MDNWSWLLVGLVFESWVYVPNVTYDNTAFRNQAPLIDIILLHSMWYT